MKLWILSDLHRDIEKTDIVVPPDIDAAILAGDICDDDLLIKLGHVIPTVFVAGNHEFYGKEYPDRLNALQRLSAPFLSVLENEEVIIGGIRFLGCTLWTDYNRGDPTAMTMAQFRMNDHRRIKWRKEPWQRFRPEEALKLHRQSRRWLSDKFKEPFNGKTVVVTHHAPSEKSVAVKYAGQVINHAYYSDMEREIKCWSPSLWIHGHMHGSFDYRIADTRVICNPHGYPDENADYKPELIVEI